MAFYGFVFFKHKLWKMFDRRWLGVALVVYPVVVAFWVVVGFEVSVYGGPTAWYDSVFVAVAEISQWWVVAGLVFVAYVVETRRRLRREWLAGRVVGWQTY